MRVCQRVGQRPDVAHRDQRRSIAQDLGYRAGPGGHHRDAALHCFERRETEPLVARRVREHAGRADELGRPILLDPPGAHDPIGEWR